MTMFGEFHIISTKVFEIYFTSHNTLRCLSFSLLYSTASGAKLSRANSKVMRGYRI